MNKDLEAMKENDQKLEQIINLQKEVENKNRQIATMEREMSKYEEKNLR